jgi:hypothetical protein
MNELKKLSECRPPIIPIRPMSFINPIGPVQSSELSQKPGRCLPQRTPNGIKRITTHFCQKIPQIIRNYQQLTKKIKKDQKRTTKKNKKMLRAHRRTVLDSLSPRRLRGRPAESQLVGQRRVVVQRRRKRSGAGGEGWSRCNLLPILQSPSHSLSVYVAFICKIKPKY